MLKSRLFCAAAVAALFMLPAFQAQAADADAAGANATVLDELTVTAARGGQLDALDVSTTTLSRADVQQAPETTIDQIVNKIPGVFTSQQPGSQLHPTGQPFNIRGFGTTTNVNTLVMIDGAPMNDPYFRTIDWSQAPRDSVNRIEVIRGGGASSLWGNLAMGGIVNIVTEAPGPDSNRLGLSYGSFNTYSGDLSLGTALPGGVRLGAGYSLTTSDGYNQTPAAFRNPYMASTSSRNQNATAAAVFTPSDTATFYVRFLDHRIREDDLVWNLTNNLWRTDRLSFGGTDFLSKATSLNFAGWYSWHTMETTNVSQTPSFSIFNPSVGAPYVSQTESVSYQSVGGSAFVDSAWKALTNIKVGADFRIIEAKDPLNLFATTGQTGAILAKAEHAFEGIFLQATLTPPSVPMDVTLGLREDFWQTRHGSLTGQYKGAAFGNALPDHSYSHFDPRLGVRYPLTDALDLRAAVYENFAAPGMNQMYRAFISGVNFTTSNPTLTAQTNLGEEVGFDVRHGGFSLEVTGYTNDLKNFIDYATVQSGCASANNFCGTNISTIAGGSLRQYVNAGDATLRGYEVIGRWVVNPAISFNAGYTRTEAYLTSSAYQTPSAGVIPDPVRQQLGQVPLWNVTAGATWRPMDGLLFTAQLKSFPAYWNSTSHTQKNDGATIIDLSASYRVAKPLEVYVAAQNVGSVRYLDQGYGYTTTNGTAVSGSTIPALGMPFNLTAGLRATF